MLKAAILGTGRYLPERVLTNDDLSKMVDTNDEWIVQRTGIRTRRIAADNEPTSELAYKAAKNALDKSGIKPEEIDYIIVATFTPDYPLPSAACLVQHKLGAKNAGAFDLAAACSGYIYATKVATGLVCLKEGSTALVIGAEKLSSVTDWKDRGSCVLFGDGAGALILRSFKKEDASVGEVIEANMYADGSGADLLMIKAGGSLNPITKEMFDIPDTQTPRPHKVIVRGNEVYKLAVTRFAELIRDLLARNNMKPEEVDCIVPHQVNQRIVEGFLQRTGISQDRVFLDLEIYGNTSAASIAIAFDEAIEQGRIKRGNRVIFVAFGGGLTWASALLRY